MNVVEQCYDKNLKFLYQKSYQNFNNTIGFHMQKFSRKSRKILKFIIIIFELKKMTKIIADRIKNNFLKDFFTQKIK